MPAVPAELKPAVSKYIAPEALFWFRWAALFTVLMGLVHRLAAAHYLVPDADASASPATPIRPARRTTFLWAWACGWASS